MQRNFIVYIFMIFMIIYIYSYVYLCIYTPSYQHFKAFAVSKFDSETTFQREFKVHSLKAIQQVSSGIHVYIYIYIHPLGRACRVTETAARKHRSAQTLPV